MYDSNVEKLVEMLYERELTISTAESCTGGMISATLVDVPGVSNILNEAYVTYSDEAKHRLLGVSEKSLEKYGAVSEQVAREMVIGVAEKASSNCAISVTGIAGPDGGTVEKPVGTVYAGFYFDGEVEVIRYNFTGDRKSIRKQTVGAVVDKMIKMIE
jgi:PncC family amidohydrolase